MGLVSIIIPAYNAEKYIDECVHSILSQTYHEIEIVIIDDGSTDSTAEKCRRLSENDSRVHYYKQNNSGVSVARNMGLAKANGEYIIFIDADDELHDSMIEKLVNDIEKDNSDVSVCDIKKISDATEKTDPVTLSVSEIYTQENALNLYLSENYFEIGVWNKLFRKSLIEDVRFVEGRRMNEDKYFIFQAFMKADKISYRKEELYYYYVRPESATKRKFDDRWFDNRYFAQKIYQEILEKKGNLEVAARKQYLLSLYYLVLVMKRNKAENEFTDEYKSIVNEIKHISLRDLSINAKTTIGIVLLKYCEGLFDVLKS